MTHTLFFQFNVPANNHFVGATDKYIDVIAKWNDKDFYYDGRPIVSISPVNICFADCMAVKDWYLAYRDIEVIAAERFADIAKQKRIEDARALVALAENPVTDRLSNVKELGTITINDLGKAEPAY